MAALSLLPCSFVSLFIFLCLHLALAKNCKKLDTCSCEMDDGSGIISLQDLDNKDGDPKFTKIPETGSAFTYDLNPCTTISGITACKDNNVCQTDGTDSFPLGGPDTSFSVDSGKVVITYHKTVYKGHTRDTKLTLSCDKSKTWSFGQGFSEDKTSDISEYSATLTSKCACPGVCHHSSNYAPSSEGLSVGSILLIIFFPLLLLYFVFGVIINILVRNKKGFPDVIPNHSFWADFPILVKDGCVFSCGKVRYCCTCMYHKAKGDSEYAQI